MIRGYIAQSTDGFVADPSGSVDFLDGFQDVDYGYESFIKEVDTVVMGRKTYDQIVGFNVGWPYAGKRGIVVTSSPLKTVLGDTSAWSDPLTALANHLHEPSAGQTWIVGGPKLQTSFLENGWMTRLDLFVMPILLGAGIPLFSSAKGHKHLRLAGTQTFSNGAVHLDYRLKGAPI